jgi:hypothetical protein
VEEGRWKAVAVAVDCKTGGGEEGKRERRRERMNTHSVWQKSVTWPPHSVFWMSLSLSPCLLAPWLGSSCQLSLFHSCPHISATCSFSLYHLFIAAWALFRRMHVHYLCCRLLLMVDSNGNGTKQESYPFAPQNGKRQFPVDYSIVHMEFRTLMTMTRTITMISPLGRRVLLPSLGRRLVVGSRILCG